MAASASSSSAAGRLRRYVYTAAFAAITGAGAVYGAGLKTRQEAKAERQKIIESTPEAKIAMLEDRKKGLLVQRMPLERKLEALRERMRDAAESEAGGAQTAGAAKSQRPSRREGQRQHQQPQTQQRPRQEER